LIRYNPPVIQPVKEPGEKSPQDRSVPQARSISIDGKKYQISSAEDCKYLQNIAISGVFEPETVKLFTSLIDQDAYILDVGANIGFTSILLGAHSRKVIGFEPSPTTYGFLADNISRSGLNNIEAENYALGEEKGECELVAFPQHRSGASISTRIEATKGHIAEKIQVRTLDTVMSELDIPRIDFLKIDVEGFEKNVIEGGKGTIERFRPVVALELNHWCLNAFQRTSVPEFFDYLRSVFPVLLAVQGDRYLDLHINDESWAVMYRHILNFEFMNIVACFNLDQLENFFQLYQPEGS